MTGVVAVIAAHADDEVLGCGGTTAKYISAGREVHLLLLADGETSRLPGGSAEDHKSLLRARRNAAASANKILGTTSLRILSLPDNRMDGVELLEVVKEVESFVAEYKPSLVITHFANDVNVDHQVVHKAVVVACRPQPHSVVKELLFMEVNSSTEWSPVYGQPQFSPNYWVDVADYIDVKLEALQAYKDELRMFPHPRSTEGIEVLARWRGSTVGLEFAEAFIAGRIIIS